MSPALTSEQEEDLIAALREADAGEGLSLDAARERIDVVLVASPGNRDG